MNLCKEELSVNSIGAIVRVKTPSFEGTEIIVLVLWIVDINDIQIKNKLVDKIQKTLQLGEVKDTTQRKLSL